MSSPSISRTCSVSPSRLGEAARGSGPRGRCRGRPTPVRSAFEATSGRARPLDDDHRQRLVGGNGRLPVRPRLRAASSTTRPERAPRPHRPRPRGRRARSRAQTSKRPPRRELARAGGRARAARWRRSPRRCRGRRVRRSQLGPLDVRAERAQALVDALVAAVDLTDVADRRACPRRRARRSPSPCRRGCPGSRAAARTSVAGPVTTTRCGSQRMIRAPIETSLSTKNRRLSNIFSKTSTVPRACVAATTAIEVRSAGNAGQMPLSIFGICPPRSSTIRRSWPGADADRASPPPRARSRGVRKAGTIEIRSSGSTSSISRSPPVTAASAAKLATSMCSGPIRMCAAVETLDALDAQHVRADPVDPRAERDEEAAEVLDVRLARGVADDRLPAREHGGHHRVLRAPSRTPRRGTGACRRARPCAGRRRRSARSRPRARRTRGCACRGADVRSRRRRAAARRRARTARAAGRRAGTTHGSPRQSSGSRSVLVTFAASTVTSFGLGPRRIGADVDEQLDHRLDVADPRDVRQRHRLGREHGRGEDRQRAVLVAHRRGPFPTAAGRLRSRTTACGAVSYPPRGGDP